MHTVSNQGDSHAVPPKMAYEHAGLNFKSCHLLLEFVYYVLLFRLQLHF